jgi:hypothetical protein
MNLRIDQLVKTLLQKDSINECSLEELQQFAERHPYFGAAQLLLTKKLQTENADGYQEQLEKTFLFFHNPLWVEHLLEEGQLTIDLPQQEPVAVAPPIVKSPTSDMIFEPYHTVDYFASQGIKLKDDEKPKDKLGQQLRSFTDWLKTMKRLPVTQIAASTQPALEKKVEEMASVSLVDREVLTEAMAQVWEKQGNHAKAIDIYSKLSLLEPSKSAYFAAKIEHLKK